MKKYTIHLAFAFFLLCFKTINAQSVGINTSNPDISSSLDISATNKGILLPQYDLIVLNDTTTPVLNPVDGLVIYNKGGLSTHDKGYYVWIKNQWHRFILAGEEPQILSLLINSPAANTVMIPQNSSNNTVKPFTVVSNKITGAFLAADNTTITLPAGKYIIRYSGDFTDSAGTGPANTLYLGKELTCVRSYFINASTNLAITEMNVETQLSDDFRFFQGTSFLNLAVPTNIKQKFEFDTGNGLTQNPLTIRTSYNVIITKMGL